MTTLYKHQQDIISADPKKTGLWLGTGSGKTRIALELAQGSILVIAPKTQVEDRNWQREMRNLNNFNILSLEVISKETFRRDHAKLPRFDTVICDEVHSMLGVTSATRWRNKKEIPKCSQLFEALDEFIERTKPDRLYLVTATPTRSPMCVWGAAKLLGHNWDYYKFRDEFYTFIRHIGTRGAWVVKKDNDVKDKLGALVRKLGYVGQLSDYFDVPDQTYKTFYIELTAKQKARLKSLPLEFPDPLVLLGKKLQVENGVLAGDEYNEGEYFENGKIEKILELAIEFPKMIVFAKYRAQIEQLAKALDDIPLLIMTGDTKDRGVLIDTAKRMETCIFICQAQISSGWELPDFPVMIFASMSYSIVDRIQAEGRILRANALKKNLYIDLVVKGGVDEAVQKAIKEKKDFSERIYLNL